VTIPAWLRLVNAAVLLSVTFYLLEQSLWAAIVAIPVALLVAAWFRYHDVPRAERAFNAMDRGRAWRLLESVPFGGRLLRRECRIYYHHVRSLCLLHEERWKEAAEEAEAALGVRGIADQAPGCHLAAAKAYAFLGDRARAAVHADSARKLPHSEAVEKGLARIARVLADAPA
jgi:hypothetical protein